MITVWSVFWGDKYSPDYVYHLKYMVRRNLVHDHQFKCITDANLPGINTVPSQCDYAGWWQKISLFKPGMATGPSLYLDLDVVVVGSLNHMVEKYSDCGLAMPANWAQSGHGGCQSSVMVWRGGTHHALWENFDYSRDSARLWGDQEYITECLGNPGAGQVTAIRPDQVVSYKYHCRNTGEPPHNARVVVFHGKPDPHEVNDLWVIRARS